MQRVASTVIQTRQGGAVERCHNIPHTRRYSTGQHQWGVAMLMHALWPEDFPRLALICLTHDVPEGWVGDIPSPTLRSIDPEARRQIMLIEQRIARDLDLPHDLDLSPEDAQKVRFCDLVELLLWCMEEQAMGNTYVADCRYTLEEYLSTSELPPGGHEFLYALEGRSIVPRSAGVVSHAARWALAEERKS